MDAGFPRTDPPCPLPPRPSLPFLLDSVAFDWEAFWLELALDRLLVFKPVRSLPFLPPPFFFCALFLPGSLPSCFAAENAACTATKLEI